MMRLFSQTMWVGILVCSATGCQSDGPQLGQVTGEITLAGLPVEAEVMFEPLEDGDTSSLTTITTSGRPSSARSDADGHFTLFFTVDQPGALPGRHRVSIRMSGAKHADGTEANLMPTTAITLLREVKPGRSRFHFALNY
jgi:hypothetical protein